MLKTHALRLAILIAATAAIAGVDGSRRGMAMPDTSNLSNELPEAVRAPQARTAPPGPQDATATEDKADGKGMTSAELRDAWLDQRVTLIDARPRYQYVESHIPDSISLPFEDFDSRFFTVSEVLDPSATVVVYCDGGDCHASHNVAALMREMGFDQILVYERGFASWVRAGYEVQSGEPWI